MSNKAFLLLYYYLVILDKTQGMLLVNSGPTNGKEMLAYVSLFA